MKEQSASIALSRPKFSQEWPPSVWQITRQRWLPTACVTCVPR